jgi:hypothetical protein
MGQVESGLAECLLREPALGYVLDRADKFGPSMPRFPWAIVRTYLTEPFGILNLTS